MRRDEDVVKQSSITSDQRLTRSDVTRVSPIGLLGIEASLSLQTQRAKRSVQEEGDPHFIRLLPDVESYFSFHFGNYNAAVIQPKVAPFAHLDLPIVHL